jgi:hypothetical protein
MEKLAKLRKINEIEKDEAGQVTEQKKENKCMML